MQQLSILFAYHIPSAEKLYIRAVKINNRKFVLELVENRKNSSIFDDTLTSELINDLRSNNKKRAYFSDKLLNTEIKQNLVEFYSEIL